jgi:hypothetical protein
MATYYRTRQGAMVHRDGCYNLRRRNVTAIPWSWADEMTFPQLVKAMRATVGYDPVTRLCADCFDRSEQLEWWRRVQGGEQEEAG